MSMTPDDEPPDTPETGFFEKLRIEVTCSADFDLRFPDGSDLHNPLRSVQLQVGYPDQLQPLHSDGSPNLQFLNSGFHHVSGEAEDPDRPPEMAAWTRENSQEIVRFDFPKLQTPVPGWDPDEVLLRKTIVYDSSDPRVDLSNGGSTFVHEVRTKEHTLVITAEEIGFLNVKFMTSRKIPKVITMVLRCRIGNRIDTFHVDQSNSRSIDWLVFSDKFADEISCSYEIELTASGPNFEDEPIHWRTSHPVMVSLPAGPNKFVSPVVLVMPEPGADQIEKVNSFVKASGS